MRTEVILTILGMAAVTFLTRFTSFAVMRQVKLPERLFRWLQYIPISILTALIVPEVLLRHGRLDLSPGNSYLVAAVVAIVVARRAKNVLLTVGSGLVTVFLMRLL